MNELQTTLAEEFKLLWRATRQERSRFMVVQYNHYDLVRQIQEEIQERYPDRTLHQFNLNKVIPDNFANQLLAHESGFVSIEYFEEILKPDNEKFAVALNQRRDAFREKDVVFLMFLPIGDTYLQEFAGRLPDLFSIVSPIIQLVQKQVVQSGTMTRFATAESTLYNNKEEAEADIERINLRLSQIDDVAENLRLRLALGFDLGKAHLFLGNFRKAKEIFTAVLKKSKKHLEAKDWTNVEAMLGWTESELGNNRKAEQLIKAALKEDLKIYPENHPVIAERKNDLALVYTRQAYYKKAIELMENAVEIDLKNFDEDNQIIAIRKGNLGSVYLYLGKNKEAIKLLEESLESILRNFGNDNIRFAHAQSKLADGYRIVGRFDESLELVESSLKIILQNFDKNHPDYAMCLRRLGLIFNKIKNYEKGIGVFNEALSLAIKNLGKKHIEIVQILDELAMLYSDKKDYSTAKKYLIQAKNILKSKISNLHEKAVIRESLKEVNHHLAEEKKST